MSDPWAEVREAKAALQSNCGHNSHNQYDLVTRLLADADALLVVVRDDIAQAYDEWLELAKMEKAEFFNDWLEHTHPLLAALPEYLKPAPNKRER